MDSAFVYMETPSMHMHVVGVFVFDTRSTPDFGYERLRATVTERLHLLPPYRRRLVEVPLRLHHPVWVEDPDFDLDYHVRRVALPAPGGRAELAELVAEIAGRPLDMRRPLWESYVVEGLDNGYAALVAKVHHAAIDGVSGAELALSFLDIEADPPPVPEPVEPWVADQVPSEVELLACSAALLVRQPAAALNVVRRTASALLAARDRAKSAASGPAAVPFRAPRTVFNASITPHRRFAFTEVPLDLVKEVKSGLGVTVNDAVLAVCAGGLRRYLRSRSVIPPEPLVAMVPVSVRADDEHGVPGNRLSAMLVPLATNEADAVKRVHMVAEAAKAAKEQDHAIGPDLLTDWANLAAPSFAVRAARLASSTRLFDRLRPMFNVVISNVPGPSFPLFGMGAPLVAMYPMGPIVEGVGLNITVMSYRGTMFFGLLACRELVPRVDEIATHIEGALAELVAEVRRVRDGASAPHEGPGRGGRAATVASAGTVAGAASVRHRSRSPGAPIARERPARSLLGDLAPAAQSVPVPPQPGRLPRVAGITVRTRYGSVGPLGPAPKL